MAANTGSTYEYVLKSGANPRKTYNVARIHAQKPIDFTTLPQPVKMYREGSENGAVKTENMSDKKRERLTRAKPWILEDDDKSVLLKGQLEGGFKQNAPVVTENARQLANVDRPRYFIFVKEGDYFSVVPIEDWFKFYPFNPHLQTMTLEEAEVKLAEIRKKEDNGEPQPKAAKVKKEKGDDDGNKNVDFDKFHAFGDIVEDEDNAIELERDAEEKGEEFDFDRQFDDDQKEDVVLTKEEGEKERNGFDLTDAGKELKKLVRTLDSTLFESDDDDDSSENSVSDSDDSDDKKRSNNNNKDKKPEDKAAQAAKIKSDPLEPSEKEKEPVATPAPSKKRKHEDDSSPTSNKKAKTSAVSDKELEDEMRQYLLVRGKITLIELIKKFKSTIEKSKDQFAAVVKRVAHSTKEDGSTYVTLKETK